VVGLRGEEELTVANLELVQHPEVAVQEYLAVALPVLGVAEQFDGDGVGKHDAKLQIQKAKCKIIGTFLQYGN